MVAPRWVNTRSQPIALRDVVRYLTGVLDQPSSAGRIYEVGGPEVLRYREMLQRAAVIINQRPLPVYTVPLLTPRLSSGWLALVTDVDIATGRNLIDSMTNEVVVTDNSIRTLLPGELTGYDDAVRIALADRAAAQAEGEGEGEGLGLGLGQGEGEGEKQEEKPHGSATPDVPRLP